MFIKKLIFSLLRRHCQAAFTPNAFCAAEVAGFKSMVQTQFEVLWRDSSGGRSAKVWQRLHLRFEAASDKGLNFGYATVLATAGRKHIQYSGSIHSSPELPSIFQTRSFGGVSGTYLSLLGEAGTP